MIKSSASLQSILLLASLSLPHCALAVDAAPEVEHWHLTSFGTLGFAHTAGDDLHARRDLSRPDTFSNDESWRLDSLIGAQVSTDLSETLSATVQGVYRARHEQSLERSIERAFVGWQATPHLNIHGGRLRNDIFMLSDYRDAGFAYPWIRPPIEFYGQVAVNSFDGLDAVYNIPLDGSMLTMRLFSGHTEVDLQESPNSITTQKFDDFRGASVAYESDRWRVKVGGSHFVFGNEAAALQGLQAALKNPVIQPAWPEAQSYADLVAMKGKSLAFYSAGVSYENLWQLSGEVGYTTSDWQALPDMIAAYFSIGRHIGQVTPYLLLASIRPLQDSPTISAPQSTPSAAANAQLSGLYGGLTLIAGSVPFNQHTVSVGARWDVLSNVALKLQWDHSEVHAGGAGLWTNETKVAPPSAATVDLVSASVNWVY